MIRFYVMAIDTAEVAKLSWSPLKPAAQQIMTEAEFRRLDPGALADECRALLDPAKPAAPAQPAPDNLFPNADPIRPNDSDPDPDSWRSQMEEWPGGD